MNIHIARFFFQISRPAYLLCNLLMYALGVGIAKYLGAPLRWDTFVLGQLWALTLQLGAHYLAAYFLLPHAPRRPNEILLPHENEDDTAEYVRRDYILWVAFVALAGATSITLMLIRSNLSAGIFVVMGLMVLGALAYSIPPLQLARNGFGAITLALVMVNLLPALGFLLQENELHRMVAMSTFPLTMLHIAMLLAFQLPNFLQDVQRGYGTFLVKLGWQRGMLVHNLLILGSYLLVGAAMLAGLPPKVGWPVFFVLPVGLFQVWYMTRIAAGAKPNWRFLIWTSISTFALTTYLLTFGFWTR